MSFPLSSRSFRFQNDFSTSQIVLVALWLWNLWRLPPCLRVKIQAWQQWLFSTLPPTSANQWSLLSWITTVSHMWHVMSCAFPYALSEAFPDFNPSFLPRGEIKDFFPSSLSSKLEKVLALKNLIHAKNYRGLHRYQWGCPWWLRWKKKKNLPAVQETWVHFLGQEDPLEKGMATHPSIPAWRIPWT